MSLTQRIKKLREDTRYRGCRTHLQFYWTHFSLYEGLSRGELSFVDQGLYNGLNARGQLRFVIPKKQKDTRLGTKTLAKLEKRVKRFRKKITFRGYESPLKFLRVHSNIYGKIHREDLRVLDFRLYKALLEIDKIKLIPSAIEEVAKQKAKNISTAYKSFKSPREIASITGEGYREVLKILEEETLRTKKSRRIFTPKDYKAMDSLYKPCKGNASEADRRSGYGISNLLRRWRKENHRINNKGVPGIPKKDLTLSSRAS